MFRLFLRSVAQQSSCLQQQSGQRNDTRRTGSSGGAKSRSGPSVLLSSIALKENGVKQKGNKPGFSEQCRFIHCGVCHDIGKEEFEDV